MVKPTVLYLDDETPLLDIFSQMFSDEYDVRTASTLAEARQMLTSCTPTIIISDWSMPEVSGLDFLREASETCPNSFRIILTGYGQVGDAIGEISAGLVELFITKPWTEDELRTALERARQVIARRGGSGPRSGNSILLMALSETLLNII
jgi:DNA-binding NtrC family response regulator